MSSSSKIALSHALNEEVLGKLADIAVEPPTRKSTLANAALAFIDALACAAASTRDPSVMPLLGSKWGEGVGDVTVLVEGSKRSPLKAAFESSVLIRWQDLSDTGPAGGHPSDMIGALLSAAQVAEKSGMATTVGDLLIAMIAAYEIQGRLALGNRFDRREIGLDHVLAIKIASAAVCCKLLGGDRQAVLAALGHAFVDGASLNAYRQLPNSSRRKGWAGPDAASRGLFLAMLAVDGEPALPAPISATPWGFSSVLLDGAPLRLAEPLRTTFMDLTIFKLVPAQRNASTAVEAAIELHGSCAGRHAEIRRIELYTHAEAIKRTSKTGHLPNPAARDHCLQFMIASALLRGRLVAEDYGDDAASDPEVDRLRSLIEVNEHLEYTDGNEDPETGSCANAIALHFADGSKTELVECIFPIGDPRRREEAMPAIKAKLASSAGTLFTDQRMVEIAAFPNDIENWRREPISALARLTSRQSSQVLA